MIDDLYNYINSNRKNVTSLNFKDFATSYSDFISLLLRLIIPIILAVLYNSKVHLPFFPLGNTEDYKNDYEEENYEK